MTGTGNNTPVLTATDVRRSAGRTSFNNASGRVDDTSDLASGGANAVNPEQRHQRVVGGNAGNRETGNGWSGLAGTVTEGGRTGAFDTSVSNTIFSAKMKSHTIQALAIWGDITNIKFAYSTDLAKADVQVVLAATGKGIEPRSPRPFRRPPHC